MAIRKFENVLRDIKRYESVLSEIFNEHQKKQPLIDAKDHLIKSIESIEKDINILHQKKHVLSGDLAKADSQMVIITRRMDEVISRHSGKFPELTAFKPKEQHR